MVGILAENGKYARPMSAVAIKVLEIFLSTFFNLYEPNLWPIQPLLFPTMVSAACRNLLPPGFVPFALPRCASLNENARLSALQRGHPRLYEARG
jgi:hypothetical protein